MIEPDHITDYRRTEPQLQEFLLFCVLVAGRQARFIADRLDQILHRARNQTGRTWPFPALRDYREILASTGLTLGDSLQNHGIGCFTLKAQGIEHLLDKPLDLRTCTVEELELIPGVGPKTARFYILHSRPDSNVAVLDTHILSWMREKGVKRVPSQTPANGSYRRLERSFLAMARRRGVSPAELDLDIWRSRRR